MSDFTNFFNSCIKKRNEKKILPQSSHNYFHFLEFRQFLSKTFHNISFKISSLPFALFRFSVILFRSWTFKTYSLNFLSLFFFFFLYLWLSVLLSGNSPVECKIWNPVHVYILLVKIYSSSQDPHIEIVYCFLGFL